MAAADGASVSVRPAESSSVTVADKPASHKTRRHLHRPPRVWCLVFGVSNSTAQHLHCPRALLLQIRPASFCDRYTHTHSLLLSKPRPFEVRNCRKRGVCKPAASIRTPDIPKPPAHHLVPTKEDHHHRLKNIPPAPSTSKSTGRPFNSASGLPCCVCPTRVRAASCVKRLVAGGLVTYSQPATLSPSPPLSSYPSDQRVWSASQPLPRASPPQPPQAPCLVCVCCVLVVPFFGSACGDPRPTTLLLLCHNNLPRPWTSTCTLS